MNNFITVIIILFLLLGCVPAITSAQPGWTVYNTSNSPLPENAVRCIAIDNNGTKWIGTDYGLAAFDDVNWTIYQTLNSGIPDNSIRSLAVDQQNNIWIGTFTGGLVKFDGSSWTVYNTGNSILPADFVRSLAVDTLNNLWVGTIGGLLYYDGTTWELYNTSNSIIGSNNIASLNIDPSDNGVAVGTVNGGLTLINDTIWTHYTISNSNLPDNTILGLDHDSTGMLWLATPASGLSGHVGGFSFLTLNTASSSISSNSLTAISIAPDESIWVSSNDSGIIKKEGINFITYNSNNSPLPDDFVNTLLVDDQGIVWAGMLQGGLVRLDESLYLKLNEVSLSAGMQLYPAPANDWLTINCHENETFLLEIYDITGKVKVVSGSVRKSLAVNTTSFAPGIYLARLIGKDGRVLVKPFVVAH
jgi:ligand-binding sensor domain-containing protein